MDQRLVLRIGHLVEISTAGEKARAYVPKPLPPSPPLEMARLVAAHERAATAIGRLDGIATALPSPALFLYMYVRKEALLSSQIEGTQSSLSDLLLFESGLPAEGRPGDVEDVSNYVAAIRHGMEQMRGGFPLSLRLVRELHGILLRSGRGTSKQPGEFRRSQNWIGGTRPGNALFVPPPPQMLDDCLSALERFVGTETGLPPLLRAGLAHVQFETIHPFLDGNGRIGRLLVTLILVEAGLLREPVLYLSLFLKRHRAEYYRLLQEVRFSGDWEAWLDFFLEAVATVAEEAAATAKRIDALVRKDRAVIAGLGRGRASAIALHALMTESPALSLRHAQAKLGATYPTVAAAMRRLVDLGIAAQRGEGRRDRVFAYPRYLALFEDGTEPLAA